MFNELINENLINLDLQVDSIEELFQEVSNLLEEQDFVTETYYDALIKREEEFPTGLSTKSLNIGLPHADPDFVKAPFIFIARNSKPLKHLQMGDNDEIESKDFLFLGIKNPSEQVGLLAKLMNLFSQDNFINDYIEVSSEAEMESLMNNNL